MSQLTKEELNLIYKMPKTKRSDIFDEVIKDNDIIYLDSNYNSFRLKLLDGDVSNLINLPSWLNVIPSIETLQYIKNWSNIWRNTSLYNIYITRQDMASNIVLELSHINEDTFKIIGEHSIHKIDNIQQLNSVLDYYLSKVDF